MKNFLKITAIILFFSVCLAAAPAQADKYGIDATVKATKGYLPTSIAGQTSIPKAIGAIVAVALSLTGVMFFILALYAGFLWMTAMGNTEQVTKAKDGLEHAIVGIVIVVAAYAITSFVFSRLISGPSNPGPLIDPYANLGCGKVQVDGGICGDNSVCECGGKKEGDACVAKGSCITLCEYNHKVGGGKCTDVSKEPNKNCPGGKTKGGGLCPGGEDNVCCFTP